LQHQLAHGFFAVARHVVAAEHRELRVRGALAQAREKHTESACRCFRMLDIVADRLARNVEIARRRNGFE
jgi:hypothetical protein